MTTNLEDLLRRVQAATGPDRELDGDLHNALFGTAYVQSSGSVSGFMTSRTDNGNPYVDRYSGSVDDALALVDRLLPGWGLQLYVGDQGSAACLSMPVKFTEFWSGTNLTAPLAILAALLTALVAQQKEAK